MRRNRLLTLLGLYQLGAGVVGTLVLLLATAEDPARMPYGNVSAALLPFGLLAAAGGALMRRDRAGPVLSLLMQALQSVSFAGDVGVWKFTAGLYVYLTSWAGKLHWGAGAEVAMFVGRLRLEGDQFMALNFVPIAIVVALFVGLETHEFAPWGSASLPPNESDRGLSPPS